MNDKKKPDHVCNYKEFFEIQKDYSKFFKYKPKNIILEYLNLNEQRIKNEFNLMEISIKSLYN